MQNKIRVLYENIFNRYTQKRCLTHRSKKKEKYRLDRCKSFYLISFYRISIRVVFFTYGLFCFFCTRNTSETQSVVGLVAYQRRLSSPFSMRGWFFVYLFIFIPILYLFGGLVYGVFRGWMIANRKPALDYPSRGLRLRGWIFWGGEGQGVHF